jgi:hypothetical protein
MLNAIPMINFYHLGKFRMGGEVHYRMYDRLFLGQLLKECGFVEPKVCSATESAIADWNSFKLDSIDGQVIKPDSLFMEAKKPI